MDKLYFLIHFNAMTKKYLHYKSKSFNFKSGKYF